MNRASSDSSSPSLDARVWERDFWLGRIDGRPVAWLRIVLGACVIQTLLGYLPNLAAWFSDDGVMPRETAFSSFDLTGSASILYSVGAPWHVALVWTAALVAAIAMTIGYRTRVASFATFVFVVGFHERLPSICDSADDVLRIALFFLCFCSSAEHYSIDASRAPASPGRRVHLVPALPVRLVQLHLASVYFWTGCFKLSGAHWLDGTAVRYALHVPHVMSRGWAGQLAESHAFVRVTTYATLAFELLFVFAVFSPYARRRTTRIALCAGAALHLGIFATMRVGQFSYLMPLSYVVFLDPDWTDRLHRALGARVDALTNVLARRMPPVLSIAEPSAPTRSWRLLPLVGIALAVQWVAMPPSHLVQAAPRPVATALSFLGLVPNWRMFAPDPLVTDYFLTAQGEFSDGARIDLMQAGMGTSAGMSFFYSRWRKFDEVLVDGNTHVAEAWADWECWRGAADPTHGRLLRFALVRESQRIPPFDAPWPSHRSRVLLKRECADLSERVR